MRRTDLTGAWFWNEYLLFNPKAGFRWLNEMNGHWVCYTTTRKPVTKSSAGLGSRQTAIYDNKTYYLFDRGYAKVKYVLGEFYWRVRQGEQTETEDYIRPPLCISKETVSQNNQQEVTWSEGKYIPAETIQDAFKLKQLPEQEGVAPAQPNLPKGYAIEFTFYSLVLTVLLFAIHGLFSFTQKDRLLLTDTYTTADYKHTKVSQPFQVTQEKAALKFSMSANVSQSWAELDIELVNDTTGEMRTLEEGVEFWSGTDSDGYWSEGSSYNDKYIGPVAPGTYHLNVDYDFQNAQNQPPILTQLSVHEGAPHSTMLWFAIIALWIFPVGCMLWAYSVETRRWVNSDYSPYQSD